MWTDAPIPAAWIREGEPRARTFDLHSSRQGGVSMNYWDCTAGRFDWHYYGDEMIEVLEGEVHITDEDGTTRVLRAGDTAHFAPGTSLLWHVPKYVRKLAFNRSAQTVPDRALSKATRVLAGHTRAAVAAAAATGAAVAIPVVVAL